MPEDNKFNFQKYSVQATTIGLTRGLFSHIYAGLINWEFFLQRNPFTASYSFFSSTPLQKMLVGTSPIFWRNGRELPRGLAWETGKGQHDTAIRLAAADCGFNGVMDSTGMLQITKNRSFFSTLYSFFQNGPAITKLSRNIQIAGIHSYLYWDVFIGSGLYYDKFLKKKIGSDDTKKNYVVKCLWVGGVTTIIVIPVNNFKNLYMANLYGQTSLWNAGIAHSASLLNTYTERGFIAAIKHTGRGAGPYGVANLMTFGTVEAGKFVRQKYLEHTEASRGG